MFLTFLRMKRNIFLFSFFLQSRIWSRAVAFDQNYRNIEFIRGYNHHRDDLVKEMEIMKGPWLVCEETKFLMRASVVWV